MNSQHLFDRLRRGPVRSVLERELVHPSCTAGNNATLTPEQRAEVDARIDEHSRRVQDELERLGQGRRASRSA